MFDYSEIKRWEVTKCVCTHLCQASLEEPEQTTFVGKGTVPGTLAPQIIRPWCEEYDFWQNLGNIKCPEPNGVRTELGRQDDPGSRICSAPLTPSGHPKWAAQWSLLLVSQKPSQMPSQEGNRKVFQAKSPLLLGNNFFSPCICQSPVTGTKISDAQL